jgi:L,D-transpeptidase YcbB
MYENGKPVDSMKVVVGKGEMPTPMMAGFIRTAIVNPYWQVPDDLVQTNIAANVLEKGIKYLKAEGYQVLADWSDRAPVVDPRKVDWQAVRQGLVKVHVRQLPGPTNFMGKVKFEFPNAQGIYLHDTPAKDLMAKDARQYSSGCVRLEDATRLGRWLMGGPLPSSKTPERSVPLPSPVPVYITYLTALPQADGQIAFQADPYKRDEIQLAATTSGLLDRP